MSDAEAQVGIDVNVMGGVEGQFQQSVKDHIRELQRVRDEIDKLTDQLKDSANHMKGGVAGGSQGRVYTGGMQSFQYEVMNRIKHLAYSSFGSGGANNFVREVLSVAAGIAISELFQTFRKTLFSKQLPALRSFPSVAATATAANVAKTYGRIPLPTLLNTSLPIVPGNQPYSVHPPVSPATTPFQSYLKRKLEQQNYLEQGGPVPTSYFGKLRAIIQAKIKERDSGSLKKEEADQIVKETLELMSGLSGYATEIGALASFVDPEKTPKLLEGLVGKTGKPLGKDPMTRLRAAFARYAKEVLTTKPKHQAEHPTAIPLSTPATEEKITPIEPKEQITPTDPEQNPRKRGGFIINPAAIIRDISIAAMHGMRHGIGAGITSLAGLGARAGSFIGTGALGTAGAALGVSVLSLGVYEGMRRWYKETALGDQYYAGILGNTQNMYGLTGAGRGLAYTLNQAMAEYNTRRYRTESTELIQGGAATNFIAGFQRGVTEGWTTTIENILRGLSNIGGGNLNVSQRMSVQDRAAYAGRELFNPSAWARYPNDLQFQTGLPMLEYLASWIPENWRPGGRRTPTFIDRSLQSYMHGPPRPGMARAETNAYTAMTLEQLQNLPSSNMSEFEQGPPRPGTRRIDWNRINSLQQALTFPDWQPQILTASQYRMGLQAEAMRAPGDQARFQQSVENLQKLVQEINDMIAAELGNRNAAQNPIRGWFE